MARFTIRLNTDLDTAEAWRRLWDLDAHSELIPLTRLSGDGTGGRQLQPGDCFIARTGIGPIGVDDVMQVRAFDAPAPGEPARAEVVKTGRMIRGRIEAELRGRSGGSELVWTQEIGIAGLPAALDPVVAAVATAAYGSVLKRLLARSPAEGSKS
ncbi:hypothetical protein [Gephyromycinifex aptenodytis]|uniref:hypothetical protein n=1 Tax=Gephyromycinifex aptenodytis TaxID=2716227 RepID=UPI001446C543|nr:hypothetical protein [Gephyromycinifex aptenodytis]